MVPEDLSSVPDEELYALEQQRTLDPEAWVRIADELRRRRKSRRALLADASSFSNGTPAAPPTPSPTLGDLERVAAGLEASLASRLVEVEARVRRLRAWVLVAPLLWIAAGAALWLALQRWAPDALRAVMRAP